MKKKTVKFISMLLCLTATTTAFFSCKGEEEESSVGEKYQTANISQGIDKTTIVDKLVENGNSDYTIVIPEDANECITYAAEELNEYISAVSGVTLPVKTDEEVSLSLKNHVISLGDTAFYDLSGIDVDVNTFNYDGFVMQTVGENLFIKGYRSSGVLYGVYDFCEQFLGVRFLSGEYTYIPEMNEIPLYKTERIEIPAFANRDYYAHQSMFDKEFTSRLRIESAYGEYPAKYGEGGTNLFTIGEGHTVFDLIPIETYAEAHPDWFAEDRTASRNQLCFSQGLTADGKVDFEDENSLAREMYYRCVEELEKNPNSRIIMISQSDSGVWCECEKCTANKVINGTNSGTMMVFINAIAEELEKWGNERDRVVDVMTMAYSMTIDPPTKTNEDGTITPVNEKVIARDNVLVKFCWMGCNKHALKDTSCTTNVTAYNRLLGWQTITSRFTIWDYATNYNTFFWWFENFESLVANFKFYREIGVEGLLTQGAPHASNYYQGHLENYLFAKLSWNPEYDVNELIDDFNTHYYGDSVDGVNEFVKLMRLQFNMLDEREYGGFHTMLYSSGKMRNAEMWPVTLMERAEKIIRDEIAELQARTDLTAEEKQGREDRLLQVLIQPMFMTLWNWDSYYDPSGKLAYAKELFGYIDYLNITYYGENASISELKLTYGV